MKKSKIALRLITGLVALLVLCQSLTGCATLISLLSFSAIPSLNVQLETIPSYEVNYTDEDHEALVKAKGDLDSLLEDPDSHSYASLISGLESFLTQTYWLFEQMQLARLQNTIYPNDKEIEQTYMDLYGEAIEYQSLIYQYYVKIYNSKHREQFFSDWPEETIKMVLSKGASDDPQLTELEQENEEIIVTVQNLDRTSPKFKDGVYSNYRKYVLNAQKIAELNGYDNYYKYMSELNFYRDYSLETMKSFIDAVAMYVPEVFIHFYDAYINFSGGGYLTDNDRDILKKLDQSFLESGTNRLAEDFFKWEHPEILDYFYKTSEYDNIFVGTEEDGSLQQAFTFVMNYSGIPVMYFGPGYDDLSTFIHEFGHAFNMANTRESNSLASLDLDEVASQAHELMFIYYLSSRLSQEAYQYYLAASLSYHLRTILLSALVADFEYEVYVNGRTDFDGIIDDLLDGPFAKATEFLGKETLAGYIQLVCCQSPCYYISYATSLMPCLELFKLAVENGDDAARSTYYKLVTNSDKNFIDITEDCGLPNPVAPKTIADLCQFLKSNY